MLKLKKILPFGIIIFLSILTLNNLWGPQFYTSHDGQSHLARLYQFDKVLRDGQFPPRWAGQFAGERGYPVFVFAYPLPYWAAEGFYFLGFNLAQSIKLVFAIFYLLSGIFMYLLVKKIFGKSWPALVSTFLWLWAPYRFVKIFVTASLGESVAFAFIPLILFFIYKLAKKPNRFSFIGLTFSLSLLILTHLITLIIFLPLILLFTYWSLSFQKKNFNQTLFLKRGLESLLLAIMISAFYLIPAIWERRYTRYHEVLTQEYAKQFVEPGKLLYSPWGYGAPKFGPGELSLQVGLAQWLATFMSFFLILYLLIRKKIKNKQNFWLGMVFLINFLLSIFLMLEISKPLWDILPPLQSVDTPWRFLSLSVFTAAFLAAWLLDSLRKNLKTVIIFSFVFLFLALYSNRNHLRINATIDYSSEYFKNYYWVGSGWDEYRPIWIKDTYHKPPKSLVEIPKGNCQVSRQIKKSNLISFNLSCTQDSEIKVQAAYYPGWELYVDNKKMTKEVIENLEKAEGLVMFNSGKGNYEIKLIFQETKLRFVSDIISLFSSLLLLFLVGKAIFYNKK